jgi:iron complex transport system permease protein
MRKRSILWTVAILLLAGILAGAVVLALCVGTADIPVSEVFSLLMDEGDSVEHTILRDVRLPRILLGIAVGGALSLAGVMLQGMFRNPLVEPYTLGISGGAAVGVCLMIVLGLSNRYGAWSLPVSGFAGATLTIFVVYFLGTRRHVINIRDLLLIGVMISLICSSLVMLALAVSRAEDLPGIIYWVMGSLDQSNILLVRLAITVSLLALVVSYFFCLDLNALALGEEEALHLGVDVENTKRLLFVLASIVTGVSVSVAGVIGFVGLVVPHFMRLFLGKDHRILLLASWLCGAAFLVLCDTAARTVISPTELPVGVITGIVGGSVFVYALSSGLRSRGGGNAFDK